MGAYGLIGEGWISRCKVTANHTMILPCVHLIRGSPSHPSEHSQIARWLITVHLADMPQRGGKVVQGLRHCPDTQASTSLHSTSEEQYPETEEFNR